VRSSFLAELDDEAWSWPRRSSSAALSSPPRWKSEWWPFFSSTAGDEVDVVSAGGAPAGGANCLAISGCASRKSGSSSGCDQMLRGGDALVST